MTQLHRVDIVISRFHTKDSKSKLGFKARQKTLETKWTRNNIVQLSEFRTTSLQEDICLVDTIS